MSLTQLIGALEAHGYGLYVRRSDAALEPGAMPITPVAMAVLRKYLDDAAPVEERCAAVAPAWRIEMNKTYAITNGAAAEESPTPVTDGEKAVDKMVTDILAPDSKINRAGRARIRQACDKKDAPPSGRDAENSAVGRISRGW